jgi:[ribosomal protein S5]-alanine N-acetyltransferase
MLEINFSPFPVIETNRLMLREIKDEDIEMLFSLRSDPEVMKYVDKPLAKTQEDVMPLFSQMREDVKNNKGISWIIALKENHEMIGHIGFWRIDKENHRGEIGYMLRKKYFGKGLATEAIKAVVLHGFNNIKFHSVEANINPDNIASQKVLEKTGFIREAFFKENYYFEGRFLDSAIYSLVTPVSSAHKR